MRTASAFVLAVLVSMPAFAAGKPLPTKPLPVKTKLDAAKRLIAETFAGELAQPDKKPAVKAMLEAAEATANDEPAQAALYLSAAEVAARSGDTRAAFDAIEKLARAFEVDELSTKLSILEMAADSAKSNETRISIANRGLELADAAAAADKFDLADDALKLAASASAKVRDAGLRKEISTKRRSVEKQRKQAAKIESDIADARRKLSANPDDSAANEALGKHLAFDRNDWAGGLKHLAKARDAQLRAVAVIDAQSPGDAEPMAKAGDLWWALAEDAKDARDRAGYKSRAAFWYTRAAGQLQGFAKTRVEKRIAEAGAEALAAAASQNGGTNGKYLDIALAPGVVMRLVKIPASKDGKIKEFYLGQTEVTQRQWQAVMGSNPSEPKGAANPANFITKEECRNFCASMNESGACDMAAMFRLPSCEEWLYALIADGSMNDVLRSSRSGGWNISNSKNKAHAVMQFPPNDWGLFDMHGNCWEWTDDACKMMGGSYDRPENADGGKLIAGVSDDSSKAFSIGFRVLAEKK